MSDKNLAKRFVLKNIESYVKTALVFLIIYACYKIFNPFLLPVVWGIIIAIALYPLHNKLTRVVKKPSLSSLIITLIFLAIIIIPSVSFSSALIDSLQNFAADLRQGTLEVPPPGDKVKEWPLIGQQTYDIWSSFHENLSGALQKYHEQVRNAGERLVSLLSGFFGTLLIFIVSIILSGVFLANSKSSHTFAITFFTALIGKKGPEIVENSKKTVSSVVTGVLGTAVLQSVILAIALFVFKVPGAPIFSLIILFFAIAQIPLILVVLPLIIYMFSTATATSAIIFTVWAIFGAISDNFIKPMLLGRGLQIPMLIILIGAIGGMLAMGIIGLFIGAVVLALGYQLFQLWIEETKEAIEQEETD
jgi:predicted PurR-regulated permease PerM